MDTEDSLTPTSYSRRSQLYRRHLAAGADFEEISGSVVVAAYSDQVDELRYAARVGLADLSTLVRTGFKGPNTAAYLEKHIRRLPVLPNSTEIQPDGSVVACLSPTEYLILGSINAAFPDALRNNSTHWRGVHQLPRRDSHSWFALTGVEASSVLAKLCGVDMRTKNFADGRIAQTSLAHINAMIIRHDLSITPCFYVLSDTSFAEYLWDVLLDAMEEFDGKPVGIVALRTLAKETAAH